jgi:hypothetical protein
MNIVTEVKLRTLQWQGHLVRMENNGIFKMVLDAKLDGKRKVARPKVRWLDDVQTDFKITGIKAWRMKAQDQSEWMDFIRETEAKLRGS